MFCQNYDISWQVHGEPVTPRRLAAMMLALQDRGCHNINFVTPGHVVPQILEALPSAIEDGPARLAGRNQRDSYGEINRHLARGEYHRALGFAEDLGLRRLDQRSQASRSLLPATPASAAT